jgi:hypothetical protein
MLEKCQVNLLKILGQSFAIKCLELQETVLPNKKASGRNPSSQSFDLSQNLSEIIQLSFRIKQSKSGAHHRVPLYTQTV